MERKERKGGERKKVKRKSEERKRKEEEHQIEKMSKEQEKEELEEEQEEERKEEEQEEEEGKRKRKREREEVGGGASERAKWRVAGQPSGVAKYRRVHSKSDLSKVRNKKLATKMKREDKAAMQAALEAAKSELLLQHQPGFLETEGMEKTYEVSQKEIVDAVDIQSAVKSFSLTLDQLGPYTFAYSKNGRNLLLGGRKGHLALLDWHNAKISTEIQVRESVKDVTFLHDHTMWAAAQKRYVCIYDQAGVELHTLKRHQNANRLQFLPYHFLLASVSSSGELVYQDTSTGDVVATHHTRLGSCEVLEQNPRNAVLHLGHSNGTVTLWTPNSSTPAVSMFCHKGPLLSISIDQGGRYMASSGMDGRLKIWDLRTYKLHSEYFSTHPFQSLHFSQRNMLATAFGPHVKIWKDVCVQKQEHPYMRDRFDLNAIQRVRFCPYDDVLGVGHGNGFSSLLIPGSGEPNYDTFEADPFETVKQRREVTVKRLLEKVQPDAIAIDSNLIGTVDTQALTEEELQEKSLRLKAIEKEKEDKKKERKRMKGRSKSNKRLVSKKKKEGDKKRKELKAKMIIIKENEKKKDKKKKETKEKEAPQVGEGEIALSRFKRRK